MNPHNEPLNRPRAGPGPEDRPAGRGNEPPLGTFLGMRIDSSADSSCSGNGCGCSSPEDGPPPPEEMEDGLHRRTVHSRRAFFLSLGKMMAAAGAVSLGATSVAKAMRTADRAERLGASRLPRADQWVMVIDMTQCNGCMQCQRACKTGHFLPSEGQNWIEVWKENGPDGEQYRPRPCMHCEQAPCIQVCPVGASYHNRNGVVLVDHERCMGCKACMSACPYDARYMWWQAPTNPPHLTMAEYMPEQGFPHRRGTVSKCVFCADYLNQSRLPRCVQQCPKDVIWFGEKTTDVVTNGREVRRLSRLLADSGATRYKEDKGTNPRVYYIQSRKGMSHETA